ncbi:hypothetical protein L579_1292 [Pantoea sp. AS-PWVM4]|nr:hypothetical protein L579_1292 [Pantoea sp. AS-PWVM4]
MHSFQSAQTGWLGMLVIAQGARHGWGEFDFADNDEMN